MRLMIALVSGLYLIVASGCANSSKGPVMSISPSATADSLVYVADRAGTVRAIASDGRELWNYRIADDLKDGATSPDLRIDSLTARSGGELYVLATRITGSKTGTVELISLNGNHIVWHREVPRTEPGINPIAVDSGAIYLAGDDGILYAFSRTDGQPKWKFQVSQGSLGSPIVGKDGTIYVTGPGHNLHAIGADGVEKWKAETHD
jgi:outer membrane protein assembly factor BamB